ncbi:MAG: O-methyltransferase [Candidatus Porifericomitaceae bacterium WSBS_2022_MAG_OTU9]
MSNKTLQLTTELLDYLRRHSLREPEVCAQLRRFTAGRKDCNMQIAPEQGQFLALLVKLMGARRILEIGTYTGYSALWMATTLPSGGEIISCDINEETSAIAKKYWQLAQQQHKIKLKLAPALQSMRQLQGTAPLDMVFIDGPKTEYQQYAELALQLLRPGGLMAVDNTLWDGKVLDTEADQDTKAIQDFNKSMYADHRWYMSMVPIADGLSLAMKD